MHATLESCKMKCSVGKAGNECRVLESSTAGVLEPLSLTAGGTSRQFRTSVRGPSPDREGDPGNGELHKKFRGRWERERSLNTLKNNHLSHN